MQKLLVSDFDKTLFTEDYEENIKAVNQFVDKGNQFIIATGRNINQIKLGIGNYKIKYSHLICNDGGIIFDSEFNVLYRKDIISTLVGPIAEMFAESPFIDEYFIDTAYELTKDDTAEANAIIGYFNDRDGAKSLLDEITTRYPLVHGYLSGYWLNITDKLVSKGNGIKELNKVLNFKEENIYTIGDTINDISMSNYESYAMEDGTEDLIAVCKGTVSSVHELIYKIEKKEI